MTEFYWCISALYLVLVWAFQ